MEYIGYLITDGISCGFKYSVNKDEERMRRATLSGRFFEKPKAIPYLWTNNLYPIALVIALILLLINV